MNFLGFSIVLFFGGCHLSSNLFTMCSLPSPHTLTSIMESECLLNRFCDLQICPFDNVRSSVGSSTCRMCDVLSA